VTTLTLSGVVQTTLALDPSVFTVTNGTLTIQQTAFSSLSNDATLSASTELLVVEAGTPFTSTLGALATEIAILNAPKTPGIAITAIPSQYVGSPFTVTGTLTNYSSAPTLTYADNSGAFVALPTGSTVTSTSFTFTNPMISTAGSDSVSVKDSNGVEATSNTFTVTALTTPKVGSVSATLVLDASVAADLFSNAGGTTQQTTNGGPVAAWKDSASGYLFAQTTTAYVPTLVTGSQNGRNGVQVATDTGSNGQLLSCSTAALYNAVQAAAISGAGVTMAVAFKPSAIPTVSGPAIYVGNPNGNYFSIGQDTGGNITGYYGPNTEIAFTSAPAAGKLVKAIISLKPSSSNGTFTFNVNGASSLTGTYTFDAVAFTIASIGNVYQNTGYPSTVFFEWDIWLSAAAPADVTAIDQYLTAKWGS
jgi:hypothetical protein